MGPGVSAHDIMGLRQESTTDCVAHDGAGGKE